MEPSQTPLPNTTATQDTAAGPQPSGRCVECGGVLPDHLRSDCTLARHEPRPDGESAL